MSKFSDAVDKGLFLGGGGGGGGESGLSPLCTSQDHITDCKLDLVRHAGVCGWFLVAFGPS